MLKRLLALLVFIPMFLIAWYARNNRQPSASSPETRVGDRREDGYSSGRPSRGERRQNGEREQNEDRGEDEDGRTERPANDGDRHRIPREGSKPASDQPGIFDFYLLNLSWSPEFCATHPDKPECAAHLGFVLHGLWPQNNDGSYPEHCSDAPGPADPSDFRDLFPDASLLRHEWSTHGTCSGLAPDTYFARARTAMRAIHIPSSLANLTQGTASTPDQVLDQFSRGNPDIPRQSFALSCGNNYLTAVEVCLDRDLHAIACSNIRSCRANSIRIVPPGGTVN